MSKAWSAGRDLRGRVARHFGRRGAALLLFGVLWAFVGVGISSVHMNRFSADSTDPLKFMDSPYWGTVWVVFGLVAIIVSALRRRLGDRDEWGFNALFIPPMIWAGAYAWSGVTFWVTNGQNGRASGLVGTLVFSIAVLAILVIAGWPDPSDESRGRSDVQ